MVWLYELTVFHGALPKAQLRHPARTWAESSANLTLVEQVLMMKLLLLKLLKMLGMKLLLLKLLILLRMKLLLLKLLNMQRTKKHRMTLQRRKVCSVTHT